MRSRKSNETETILASMLSAAVASGITYFLYGTDEGGDTRKRIGNVTRRVRDKAMEVKDEAIVGSNMLYTAAKESYDNMSVLLNEHKTTLKNLERDDMVWLAERFKERMTDVWEETRDDIEEVLDDARA